MPKNNQHYHYVLFILSLITIFSVISCNHDKQSDVAYDADAGCVI